MPKIVKKDKNSFSNMDRYVKLSIIALALAGIYYFVIYLPSLNQQKLDQQKLEQQKLEQEKAQNSLLLEDCLKTADDNYRLRWANTCKSQGKMFETDYQNCINQGLGTSFCESTYKSIPRDTSNCLLPQETIRTYEQTRQNASDECFKKYPQK